MIHTNDEGVIEMKIVYTYVLDTNKLGDFMKMFHSNGWIGHNKDKIKAVMNAEHI